MKPWERIAFWAYVAFALWVVGCLVWRTYFQDREPLLVDAAATVCPKLVNPCATVDCWKAKPIVLS